MPVVRVKIIEGKDLPVNHTGQFRDYYCKITLNDLKYLTKTIHGSSAPVWNAAHDWVIPTLPHQIHLALKKRASHYYNHAKDVGHLTIEGI